MRKRVLSLLLVLCLTLALLPVLPVGAKPSDTGIPYAVEGGNIYFDKETGTVTGCDFSVTRADIPSEIDGVAVTTIGSEAFWNCNDLTEVTIPDSVNTIGYYAFAQCYSLTEVTIPGSVTEIGDYAFESCTSLTAVTIPNSVTEIGDHAFAQCYSLTEVTIPGSVTEIGDYAFESCTSLTAVTIPNSVTTIGGWAFVSCDSLTAVTIGNGVTEIGAYAFSYCDSLTEVTIPNSVTTIGRSAFLDCDSLKSIEVSNGNPNYSSKDGVLFDKAQTVLYQYPGGKAGAYVIPGSVTTIGDYAFYACKSLTSATMQEGVMTIDDCAFDYCSALTAITIPGSVKNIDYGECLFEGCTSLQSISVAEDNLRYYSDSAGALFDRDYVKWGQQNVTALLRYPPVRMGSYQIPEGVSLIENFAFSGCVGLTSVTISDGVTKIGSGAFYNCSGLTSVIFQNGELAYDLYVGYLYLGYYLTPGIDPWENHGAFDGCTNLRTFTVSDNNPSLSSDESGALFNKDKTLLIRLPEGYSGTYQVPESVKEISNGAFYNCANLTTVTIPEGMTKIGDHAFHDCSSLTAVYFRGDAPELEYYSVFSISNEENEYGGEISNPNLTLYYIEGKSGWTSPIWGGCPTATWDGKTDDPKPDDPKPDDPKPDNPSTPTFTDVPANAWFAGAVDYAVENGLMNGMGNNQFQPNTSMTRGMLVTVLWRYAESPKQGENTFTDVPAGKYYTDAVAWAAANGIVNGVGNGKFNPDGNITREQLVTILYRYCKQINIDTSKSDNLTGFPDAGNVGNSAKDAMRWAVAEKLIGGKSLDASGTVYLQPKGSATRAEVATILMRFIENILK